MRTRREITLEMDRWVVVSRPKKRRWCSTCALEVEMISIDDAALREAQSRKDAVRAYELVYAALGA